MRNLKNIEKLFNPRCYTYRAETNTSRATSNSKSIDISGNAETIAEAVGCCASTIRKRLKGKSSTIYKRVLISKTPIQNMVYRSIWNGTDYYENVNTAALKEILDIDAFGACWDNIRKNGIGIYKNWLISQDKNIMKEDYLYYTNFYAIGNGRMYFGGVKTIMKSIGIPPKYYDSIYHHLLRQGFHNWGNVTIYKKEKNVFNDKTVKTPCRYL